MSVASGDEATPKSADNLADCASGLQANRLPVELWCEIAQYLDVISLVRFSAVSTSFNHLINSARHMWSFAVVRMIRENCLPSYSLPIDTANAVALKAMATKTPRSLFAVRKRRMQGGARSVLPVRSLASKKVEYINDDQTRSVAFQKVFPGSRWVLTGSNVEDISHLLCWDLEYLSRPPVTHHLRHNLAIFELEGDESVVVCQSAPDSNSVIVMARTYSAEGEYDIEMVRLSWKSAGGFAEAIPVFETINRLNPPGIFIEHAYLEGNVACMGSGQNWIFWDWESNRAVQVDLGSSMGENTMHIMLRPDAFFTVSRGGRISTFSMPILRDIVDGIIERKAVHPLATSTPYGTLRKIVTLDAWIPMSRRSRSLVCMKTTTIPESLRQAVENRAFACPAILIEYGPHSQSLAEEGTDSLTTIPSSDDLLPKPIFYGRGNLDWRGVFTMADGMLLEQSVQFKQRNDGTGRRMPHIFFDCHHMFRSGGARDRRVPLPGSLILETAQYLDPLHEDEYRNGLYLCHVTGRALLVRPRIGCIETFEFD